MRGLLMSRNASLAPFTLPQLEFLGFRSGRALESEMRSRTLLVHSSCGDRRRGAEEGAGAHAAASETSMQTISECRKSLNCHLIDTFTTTTKLKDPSVRSYHTRPSTDVQRIVHQA